MSEEDDDLDDATPLNTASPQRNFTLTLDERVKGLGGPPAYAVRKRRIEDLEAWLVDAILELPKAEDGATAMYECWEDSLPSEMKTKLRSVNKLIEQHNTYYPIESNMPINIQTGELMDAGEPWKRVPPLTWAVLQFRANEKRNSGEPLKKKRKKSPR